jgi:2-polyprenyl-3-methyl-5-hydroxy-6-metoxy-1,4-benzoquinol methylase
VTDNESDAGPTGPSVAVRVTTEQRVKQALRCTIGEPYVGKRLKLRRMARAMPVGAVDEGPMRILDFGTEDATFVYWLADRYPTASVTAIDLDTQAMAICQSLRPSSYATRVEFVATRIEELPSGSFDLITAFDVLEHIDDDGVALTELARVLDRGGDLLIHVPRDQWMDAAGRVERVADADAWQINPGHVRMGYSPERLRDLVRAAGLDVVDIDLWVRRWGVRAHRFYARLEHPAVLRALTVPFTDLAAALDRRRPVDEGNTVWIRARKPGVGPGTDMRHQAG